MSEQSTARLVAHPEPGKVWVEIPHRNDISSDWIAVDELTAPTPDANDPSAQEGLAGVIAAHEYDVVIAGTVRPACKCGWVVEGDWEDVTVYDAHLADAILRAGFGPVRAIEAEREFWRSERWEAQAKIAALVADVSEWMKWGAQRRHAWQSARRRATAATARAESATAAHTALVAGIEGLADEAMARPQPGYVSALALRALLPTAATETNQPEEGDK